MATARPFTSDEIDSALSHLPGWKMTERTPAGSDHVHVELHRLFEFSSFAEAMHFMLTASRFIHLTDHHPCWQNLYSRVEVWITTGDLKHRISSKDVSLAHYLEGLYEQYKQAPEAA